MIKTKNPEQLIRILQKRGERFILQKTTLTTRIEWNGEKIFFVNSETNLNNYELNLIKAVKSHVEKNVPLPFPYIKPIYIDLKPMKEGQEYTDIFELDLSAAFWQSARELKIISEEIYQKGLHEKISKKARLLSLGNLAKTILESEFNGKEFSPVQIISNKLTEGCFFGCAQRTSEIMLICKMILGADYLFFWCDAIFFKPGINNVQKLAEYLQEINYPFKVQKISFMKHTENKVYVYHQDEKRVFNFQK